MFVTYQGASVYVFLSPLATAKRQPVLNRLSVGCFTFVLTKATNPIVAENQKRNVMKSQYSAMRFGVLSGGAASIKKEIFHVIPKAEKRPPVFREHPVYDAKYCKKYEATMTGVFFFLVPIMFIVFCFLNFVQYEGYHEFLMILSVGALVLRVIATIWVAQLSKEQNRNSTKWIAFSFFLPGSALIVIGQKRKIFDPSEWRQFLYIPKRSMAVSSARFAPQQKLQLAS